MPKYALYLLLALPAAAQFWQPGVWTTVGAGTLAQRPATCTAKRHVYVCVGSGCTNDGEYHYCTATNTWGVPTVGDKVTGAASLTGVSVVPRVSASGVLGPSKLSCSGTPVTCTFYDDTATTGAMTAIFRPGAGQSTTDLVQGKDGSNVTRWRLTSDSTMLTHNSSDVPKQAIYDNLHQFSSDGGFQWKDNVNVQSGSVDLQLVRPGAGIAKFTGASATYFVLDGPALMLQFGGTTSSFSAVKRNGAKLEARLADDTASTQLIAADPAASGDVTTRGTTWVDNDCVKLSSGKLITAGAVCGAGAVTSVTAGGVGGVTVGGTATAPTVDADPAVVAFIGGNNNFTGNNKVGVGTDYVDFTCTNNTTTGTANKLLVKLGTDGKCVKSDTTDTTAAVGIVVSGGGTTGSGRVAFGGFATCTFSNATTQGNWVQISGVTAGNCLDAGASKPGTGQIIGRISSTGGAAGDYTVLISLQN